MLLTVRNFCTRGVDSESDSEEWKMEAFQGSEYWQLQYANIQQGNFLGKNSRNFDCQEHCT